MNYLIEAADCYAQLICVRAKTSVAKGTFDALDLSRDEVVSANLCFAGEKNYSDADRELIVKLIVEMHTAASGYLDEVHGMGSKDI